MSGTDDDHIKGCVCHFPSPEGIVVIGGQGGKKKMAKIGWSGKVMVCGAANIAGCRVPLSRTPGHEGCHRLRFVAARHP
jgi:hypothetical protein